MAYPYIPSKISQSPAVVGKLATLVISAYGTTFTHTVQYNFGSFSGEIVSGMKGGSYIWTIPNDFYDEIGVDETSKSGTLICTTYTGDGVLIGTSSCSFTVSIDSEAVPNIDSWVYDVDSVTTALTGDNTKIIQGHSDIHCEMQATSMNGSDIASVKITDGIKYFNSYSGTFEDATRIKYTFYATDSRGLTASKSRIVPTIYYRDLTCKLSNTSFDTDGTCKFTIGGIFWNDNFGKTNNTLSVQYRHREGDGAWGDWVPVTGWNLVPHHTSDGDYSYSTYTQTITLTGLNYESPQFIQARATDKLGTVTTEHNTINATPIFDWSDGDFNFNVPVKFSAGITGLTTLDGIYGTCDTTENAAAKVVDCEDFPELTKGVSVRVKFTYGNNAAAPTLNVRGTGAKTIVSSGASSFVNYWVAGEILDFVYDGTYWVLVNGALATTANYGKTLLGTSVNDDVDRAVTPKAVKSAISNVNSTVSDLSSRVTSLNSKVTSLSNQQASTTTAGMVKLATSVSSDNTTAATPGAVQNAITAAMESMSAVESGEWTPTLSVAIQANRSTLRGWYQKVGNVVTIGFYIDATGTSDVSGDYITIDCDDIPYFPDSETLVVGGGGYLYGSSGTTKTTYDFKGWQAGKYGYQNMRIMPCGTTFNTTGTTMQYPSYNTSYGAWHLNASGTICFAID